jgi:hypothetical protein
VLPRSPDVRLQLYNFFFYILLYILPNYVCCVQPKHVVAIVFAIIKIVCRHTTSFISHFLQAHRRCHTLILIPWSGSLPKKLIVSQLVEKFPEFNEVRKFIFVFTRALHVSLTRARSVQSIMPQRICLRYRRNIILPSIPSSSKRSLSLRFPHQNPASTPHLLSVPPISYFLVLSIHYRAWLPSSCHLLQR